MVDWKKEIKLGELVGRRSDDDAPVATVAPPGEVDSGETADEKSSIWKREIRLRRPSETPEGSVQAPEPAAGAAGTPAKRSRFARPGASERGAVEQSESAARRSRFTRPGTPKPETVEPRSRRFGRGSRQNDGTETSGQRRSFFSRAKQRGDQVPEQTGTAPRTWSRFAKAGGTTAKPAEPRPRGRSPLSREVSLSSLSALLPSRRRRPATADSAGDGAQSGRAKSRKLEIVGLKVGASHMTAAHVVNNGHSEVVQVAREGVERGVVVGGELRDPAALGAALGDFFRRHKLPQKAVRLGIGTNRIGVRRLEITGLQNASHLENAIRFRAQEVLPIPLEEAVLDYQVVSETTDEKGNVTYRVLLVVAYRDLIQRYVQACRIAGLKLVGIDLEAFALLRALGPQAHEPRDDAAVVVVSIGHDRSTFVVADGDTCEFARVLDWGGGALDVAIARALDRTPSQVEPIKHSLTLNATQERVEGHTPEQATAVYEAVRKELQTFVRELVSSLHFYQNQPGSLGIGEITITGGTAQLPGLAAELQRLIGVSVRVGDPFERVVSSKRIDQSRELGSLAVAIGLGLEG